MSNEPHRAAPEGSDAAPPSESSHLSQALEATSPPPSSPAERKGPPIRIGTQRYGVKPPTAVPKPVLGAPPRPAQARSTEASDEAAEEKTAPAATASAADAPIAAAPSEADASVASSEAASPATAAPQAASPSAPAPRQEKSAPRELKARPDKVRPSKVPVMEPARGPKVELPNVRAGLSEDLELEYMAALGGQSVDEIIQQGTPTEASAELEPESRQRAKVVAVHRDDVFVELPGRQQGVVPLKGFAKPPEEGTVVEVIVTRFNAPEGMYELNMPGAAVDVGDWSEVAEGMIVEARVTGHNKGGLECEVNRLRGFIPASQASMYRVEDLAQFVDQKFACVITEANPEKRNLVLSRRAVLEREKAEAKEHLMASLEVGQSREGVVRSLQPFGAFVDLGGVDGLIHISQLSWDRIKHAEEVLALGQTVKVRIQRIDPQTGKISLAFRDLSENPWANVARDFPARSRVKGTVSRLMEFGAFVRLAAGVEGLIHISELSYKRVFRVSDVLSEGQDVEVMVLSVDPEQQRISLSLKALEARPTPAGKAVEEETAEDTAEPETPAPPKKRKVPLKGGIGGGNSVGEKFGLKW